MQHLHFIFEAVVGVEWVTSRQRGNTCGDRKMGGAVKYSLSTNIVHLLRVITIAYFELPFSYVTIVILEVGRTVKFLAVNKSPFVQS